MTGKIKCFKCKQVCAFAIRETFNQPKCFNCWMKKEIARNKTAKELEEINNIGGA